MIRPGELIINDLNFAQHISPVVNGEQTHRGLIPRDYSKHPAGSYAAAPMLAVTFPLIPRSEWPQRIKDKVATQSQLSDLRLQGNNGQPIPSLDQDGVGYCWAHSSTQAVILLRAINNQPYVPLSAFCVAATIKKGADEGGWGAQSLDFITDRGVCSQALWPQGDRNYRQHDKPEVWANAALHKTTEGWVDLAVQEYDRTLTFDQECTLLLSGIPVVKDENWWSHSILGLDVIDGSAVARSGVMRALSGKLATTQELENLLALSDPVTAGFGVRIWNSWGDAWSDRGMGTLVGQKAVSDGAVAPRVTGASPA